MGVGEVGFHLARSLSQDGHSVTVIEKDPVRAARVEEELDVLVVLGNGAHSGVLTSADVGGCELFMSVSSNDEANLAAALISRTLGAQRTVVRLAASEEVLGHRKIYEDVFHVDLLLSTQVLTTTRILNLIRGLNTVAIEHFADGKVQLRKIGLDADSLLVKGPLREVELPGDCLVVAYFRGDELVIPAGDDRAEPGDEALILGRTEVIGKFEKLVDSRDRALGTVVLAGGGETALTVARSLDSLDVRVLLIEQDRSRARQLASVLPYAQILHGDATDLTLLKAEQIGQADFFIALTGNDETNLMASLLALELGVEKVVPMVQRAETTRLWRRLDLDQVFSPRRLAYERVKEYIANGYSANIVSLSHGKAQVLERRLFAASPAAGVTLAEMNPPRGLIVGAVARGRKVFVPGGDDRLEEGDLVILFVHAEELDTVQLLFPGRDLD